MPVYSYKAKDQFGTTVKGETESTSQLHLFEKLKESGYFVCSIKENDQALLTKIAQWGQKIKAIDLIIFTRQLSTLLDAGIPINTSLNMISGQIENKGLAQAVHQIRSDIEAGSSLGDALKKQVPKPEKVQDRGHDRLARKTPERQRQGDDRKQDEAGEQQTFLHDKLLHASTMAARHEMAWRSSPSLGTLVP